MEYGGTVSSLQPVGTEPFTGHHKRAALSVMRKKTTQIANAARKSRPGILTSIYYLESSDGMATLRVLELLSGDRASEDNIIEATAAIGRLMEVFDAIDAVQLVEHAARQAAPRC